MQFAPVERPCVDPELGRMALHVREGNAHRLFHDVAKLARQRQPLVAVHPCRLDEEHVAAGTGHGGELEIPDDAFDERDFHVHVPAGAIPKDGPSAGITMTTALASLLSGRPVKHTVGMTGEVTLQGRVLPIGGLKQKVLAAHAAGLTDVILPERNRADLDDVPDHVRDEMTFHPVMTIGEVLELALEPARESLAA